MEQITITIEDFDKATSLPWSPRRCLLSIAGIRQGYRHARMAIGTIFAARSQEAKKLMHTFDANYSRTRLNELLSEVELEALQALRSSLPVTVYVSDLPAEAMPLPLPEHMTRQQVEAATRTCERWEVPFVASEWQTEAFCDGAVVRDMGTMFIIIERDGYAHS